MNTTACTITVCCLVIVVTCDTGILQERYPYVMGITFHQVAYVLNKVTVSLGVYDMQVKSLSVIPIRV